MNPLLITIDTEFAHVIALISSNRDEEALKIFSVDLEPLYSKEISGKAMEKFFTPLFVSVKEFLTSSAARSTGLASRENVLAEYSVYVMNERLELFL